MRTDNPTQLDQETVDAKCNEVTAALSAYGAKMGYRGLEGRALRGLDSAGMLAVPETRKLVERLAAAIGANMARVESLTKELHEGAIWENAELLAEAKDPNVVVWMILANCTTGDHVGDMKREDFIADLEQVITRLETAVSDPQTSSKQATTDMVERAGEQFEIEDGVPISQNDAFLHMAIKGYETGLVVDKSNIIFVGSNELTYEILESMGLTKTEKEDRGRLSTFYVKKGTGENDKDVDVVKVLYPGFCIVLNGDKELAKTLARTGMKKKQATIEGTRKAVNLTTK